MTKDEAIRRGWLNEDGALAGGGLPLVEPVKKRDGAAEPDIKSWRTHVKVSVAWDERDLIEEPAPAAEPRRGIPADTLRRLRYAAFETIHEDGSRTFKHDPRIESDTHIPLKGK